MVYRRKPRHFNPRFEVVSCFCEYDNTILLLRLKHNKFQGGRWGVPAGKANEDELLVDAMLRELKEETQIEIALRDLRYLNNVFIKFKEVDFVYHMFKIQFDFQPDVRIDAKEHIDYQWLQPTMALKLDLIEDEDRCIKMWYH